MAKIRVNANPKNYAAQNHIKLQLRLSNHFDARLFKMLKENKMLVKLKGADGSESYEQVDGLDSATIEVIRKRLVDIGRTDARAAKAGSGLTPFQQAMAEGRPASNPTHQANGHAFKGNLAQYRDKPSEHVVKVQIEGPPSRALATPTTPAAPPHPEFARLIGTQNGNGNDNG